MPGTVKNVSVSYTPINEKDIFTNGDFVSGQVKLEVAKTCQIGSLSLKFKGESKVRWSEKHGQVTVVYQSKDKYFISTVFFVQADHDKEKEEQPILLTGPSGKPYSNVVEPGCHVYPFSFQFPAQEMPPSFVGLVGKISYKLTAKLSRSMRIPRKDIARLNFFPNTVINIGPELMTPQSLTKDKKMHLFTSGTVAMDVEINKTGFFQGEGMKVVASIHNNSSRDIKPKYCLYYKHTFLAEGRRKVFTKDLIKEVGEKIPPSVSQTVTRTITIPPDMEPSILNCSNIKVEHRLRVYLDVKYATDPHVKFPLVIFSASKAPTGQHPSDFPASDFGACANPNQNQPDWSNLLQHQPMETQPSEPPPSYESLGLYPSTSDFAVKY